MKKLSVVIPAYNEEATLGILLSKLATVDTEAHGYTKEILVINDGSKDRTAEIARSFPGITCLEQVPNQGKGRAVQRGIRESTGDLILIQDADMEYNPDDYLSMLDALAGREDLAIYGSRPLGQIRRGTSKRFFPGRHTEQSLGPWVASIVLSVWTYLLYQTWISDTLTAYKLYPASRIKKMKLETKGFETDHEITARLLRQGVKIREVPIDYRPRSVAEGKKIKPIDGLIAVATLWKYRWKK